MFSSVVPSHAVPHVLHSSWGDCVVHGTVDSKIQELTRITSIGFDPVYRWAPPVYPFIPVDFLSPAWFFQFWALPVHTSWLFELCLIFSVYFWALPVHISLFFELCPFIPVNFLSCAHSYQFTFWAVPIHASLLYEFCPFMAVYFLNSNLLLPVCFLSSTRCCRFTFWALPIHASLLFDHYPFMPLYSLVSAGDLCLAVGIVASFLTDWIEQGTHT